MKKMVIICGMVLLFPRLAVSDGYWVSNSIWNVAQVTLDAGENFWGRAEYKAAGCSKCGCPCDEGVCTCGDSCQCANCASKIATVELPSTDEQGNRYYKDNGKWKCLNKGDGQTYTWDGSKWSLPLSQAPVMSNCANGQCSS